MELYWLKFAPLGVLEKCVLERPWKGLEFLGEKKCTNPVVVVLEIVIFLVRSRTLVYCYLFMLKVMRIIDCIRPDKQTVMFSATFPRQMESLARKILSKPVEVVHLFSIMMR